MTEISNFTMKALKEIASILPYFTPENIALIQSFAQAEADSLKLTAPERAARAEYVAKIVEHDAKLKSLKEAEAKDADTKNQIVIANQELESGRQALKNAKDDHAKAVQSLNDRNIDLVNREQLLALGKNQVDIVSKANESESRRLREWSNELSAQAADFEQATQLIKKRK